MLNKYLFFGLHLILVTYMIVQAHVEYETAKRHYAHVDCPGHADYVKVSLQHVDIIAINSNIKYAIGFC